MNKNKININRDLSLNIQCSIENNNRKYYFCNDRNDRNKFVIEEIDSYKDRIGFISFDIETLFDLHSHISKIKDDCIINKLLDIKK